MTITRRFQFVEDSQLVELAQRGSLEAYDELVSRFRDAVILVVRQTVRSLTLEAAQDVAQETFVLAFRSLDQLQDANKFAGWLCMIARRRALRVAQGKIYTTAMETASLDSLVAEPADTSADTPLDLVIRAEQQEAVRALLADLAPDCQTVLLLFYYEQWPAARIAAFLSLPLTTVKWRLRYGRKQLTPHLAKLLDAQEPPKQPQEQQESQDKSQDKQKKHPKQQEEKTHVRSRSEEGSPPRANPAGTNGRDGRTRRADGQASRAAFRTL